MNVVLYELLIELLNGRNDCISCFTVLKQALYLGLMSVYGATNLPYGGFFVFKILSSLLLSVPVKKR